MAPESSAPETVLIIEDDSTMRSLLAEFVYELGLIVVEAENGLAGLARAREARPDVILLDIHMPLMDGREILAILKDDPSLGSIPVLVVSGSAEDDLAAACIEAGADDYLTKPVNRTLLHARLRSTLERTRMRARERVHLRQIEDHALLLEERVQAKSRGLAEAHERLRVLDQAKDEFLSLIAHELRTPVTGVLGASEGLRDEGLDEPGRAMAMSLLHLSIERLLRIVEDALLLTRIKVSPEGSFGCHPLAPIWASAAEQASRVAAARGVLIAPPEGLGPVICEAALLVQGLAALLECAVKFSAPGETVRTTCTTVGGSLKVRIEATGLRIPAEAIPGFFDLLSLAKPITPGGDLGLGPPVAAQILEMLGGSVAVMGTDKGTAFVVTLESAPAAGEDQDEPDADLQLAGVTRAAQQGLAIRESSVRRAAEKYLAQMEGRYRGLLEAAPDAMVVVNQGGEIVLLNVQAERQFGYHRSELVGQEVTRVIPEGFAERLIADGRRSAAEALGQHLGTGIELTGRRKDGSEFPLELMLSPLESAEGVLVTAAIRDISLRKHAENHLLQMEARYRGLLQAAPDAMVVVNQGGEIVLLNAQAEKQFGYDPAELVGQKVTSIIPEGFAARLVADGLRSEEDALAQQIGEGIELTGRRKNGSEFPIKIMLSPLESTEGILVTAAIRDITVRKRDERRLLESEKQYRLLFDGNPQPMWVFDVDTLAFLAVNDAAVRLYGFARNEFLGMTITEIRPQGEVASLLEYLATIPASPSLVATQVKHRKKDGSLLEVAGVSNPIEFHGRHARLVMATDVTEKKRLEAQLFQAQKMEAVGRLAGGVAHDFNNILGVIIGYGEMAQRQLVPEHPVRSRVDQMVKAAGRAAGLTRQLLAFSRKQVLDLRVLDLNAVVEEVDKMLGRLIGEDIDLVLRPAPGLGTVKADRGQIEQIVLNLAVNARDAMPAGGSLTIETANADLDQKYARAHVPLEPGRYVMLAVSDTGIGMDEETRLKIFEPFFTTKPEGQGTGLGLSTVYGIVKQSGGCIWVYSEPGMGTTFKVYLPRLDEPAEPVRVGTVPAEAPRSGETILLVEDTETLQQVIRELLEECGYTVLLASNGADALALAGKHADPIDLLLTDVVMPKLGGGPLAKLLSALRPAIRVLYMSGYTDGAISHHGILGEGVMLLEKPFTRDQLARAVRDALDRPSPT